jgi:hypothetical protein
MSGHHQNTELFRSMINRVLEKEIAPFYEQWEEKGIIPRDV